jgi:outer membrane protein assembly factor BamB
VLEWTCELGVGTGGSPVPYPANNPDSFVFGHAGRVFRVSAKGEILFDKEFGPEESRGGHYDPRVADLDGDGTDEIVSGHNDGYVFALDGKTGETIWQIELGAPRETWQMATPADLDGDGTCEVIVTDLDGWVTCLSHNGQLLWRSKVEEYRLSTPAVGDIDNDGQPEIVYGSATRHLIALEADGTILWDQFVPPHHMGRTYPLIADLDEDGKAEVYSMSSMIGRDVGVVAVNGADGSLRWIGATWHKAYHGRSVLRFDDGTLGLLICDKGNNVGAYQADGTLRWKTNVGGRGIWTVPATGDLDGDGKCEVVVTVRGVSRDEQQTSWYVLSAEGEILGSYAIGGGFGAATIGDADQDGVLEVVLVSEKGVVHCYSFGGKATENAVFNGSWTDLHYPLRHPMVEKNATPEEVAVSFSAPLPEAQYGNNTSRMSLPEDEGRLGLEVTTQFPDLSQNTQVFHPEEKTKEVEFVWPVRQKGEYKITFRLLDFGSGEILGEQVQTRIVTDPTSPIASNWNDLRVEMEEFDSGYLARYPSLALSLAKMKTGIDAKFGSLYGRTDSQDPKSFAHLKNLADEVENFLESLETTQSLLDLLTSECIQGKEPSFVLWQDDNPWDNLDPMSDLPEKGGPLEFEAWAFGNEIESVAVNAVNLSPHGITLRIEPGTVKREGEDKTLRPAHEVADLRRAVDLPSRFGETVPDMLPSLGEGYLLDIAPLEAKRLWINLSSRDLDPGTYVLEWTVRTLDMPPATSELKIRFTVSPVSVPEENRFLANFWARPDAAGPDTAQNLIEHLQTIWYGLPMPSAKATVEGKLDGELDWTAHDAALSKAKNIELILYSGPPSPTFPEGVEVTEELRLKADRNYAKAFVEHLRTFGLDYENFMFYIEDETGLNAGPEHYIERASYVKKIDPRYQCYANPWGGITKEHIEAMWPYTDVWQPGMETIEYLGPEYVAAMRPGGRRISTYTPPGNCRVLRPLGFFRAQAWQAFHWGIEGGGWWVYQGDDLWGTDPNREPGYGGVYYDGRELVDSRRWEANRDGIEDFNILSLLRDLAEEKSDADAKKVLEQAVAYVAGETITGMPREAADYDFDYSVFMGHRKAIRDGLERLLR